MNKKIVVDYSKVQQFIKKNELSEMKKIARSAADLLLSKSGAGNNFLGWIDWPINYDKEEVIRIKNAAEKIKNESDVFLVIGIGGSYLGSKAAIDFLKHNFYNNISKKGI